MARCTGLTRGADDFNGDQINGGPFQSDGECAERAPTSTSTDQTACFTVRRLTIGSADRLQTCARQDVSGNILDRRATWVTTDSEGSATLTCAVRLPALNGTSLNKQCKSRNARYERPDRCRSSGDPLQHVLLLGVIRRPHQWSYFALSVNSRQSVGKSDVLHRPGRHRQRLTGTLHGPSSRLSRSLLFDLCARAFPTFPGFTCTLLPSRSREGNELVAERDVQTRSSRSFQKPQRPAAEPTQPHRRRPSELASTLR